MFIIHISIQVSFSFNLLSVFPPFFVNYVDKSILIKSLAPAQQATGQPIYGYGYPYPVHLYQTMMPLDYGINDEKSDDGSDS